MPILNAGADSKPTPTSMDDLIKIIDTSIMKIATRHTINCISRLKQPHTLNTVLLFLFNKEESLSNLVYFRLFCVI